MSSADDLCRPIRPGRTSGLIWIQIVYTLIVLVIEYFWKVDFEKSISIDFSKYLLN